LINLSDALEEKRLCTGQERKVVLLHDNARPHVGKATQDYIFARNFSRMRHIAGMILFDYYLFRLLQHHLADTHFMRFEEIWKCIDDFIASKLVSFYRQGIRKLPEKWQKIVYANGEYFAINMFLFVFE